MMQKPCVSPRRSSRHGAALALWVAICLAGCGGPRVQPPNAAHQAATSLNQTAARALAQGETEQALALYARALAAADSVEDFELAGTTLLNLALVHARLGQLAEAQARLDRIIAAPQLYPGALQAQAAARQSVEDFRLGKQMPQINVVDERLELFRVRGVQQEVYLKHKRNVAVKVLKPVG